MKYKEIKKNLNKIDQSQFNPVIISVISNITFEPYFNPLIEMCFAESKTSVNIFSISYEEYDRQENRNNLSQSEFIIVWLYFESLFPESLNEIYSDVKSEQELLNEIAARCGKLLTDISACSRAHVIWFLFEDYYNHLPLVTGNGFLCKGLVDKLNTKIMNVLDGNVSLVDLKKLIAEIGTNKAYDSKGKYRWNAPYSKQLIEVAVKEIYKQYLIEKGITKKCLVLDCDNVLWGGILSEDGIEQIKLGSSGLGRAYQDFQRFLLTLYYHGVILAICSKNDLSDVLKMFQKHSEMVLKEEHIACFQVNWDNKPDNIRKIAETLNIGLDSIVFIDDSPIEIEAVKALLPEVTAIMYERDSVYEQLSCFNLKSNVKIADIEKRNETYRTNQSREALKAQYDNYSEYINALEIKMDVHEATHIEFNRISDLTQRTNKCTNGKRYTVAEIKERIQTEEITIYSLSVSDRFSDLGLVGALEVEGDTLTLFSLSCRALGREIENKMLAFIADNHQINTIEFHSTGKNEDIKTLLTKAFPNAAILP